MKRLLFLSIAMLIGLNNMAYAGKAYPFAPKPVKPVKKETTIAKQANIFYAENNIEKAFSLFLTIPEEDRTAQDYLILGNILQDQGKSEDAMFMYNRALMEDENYYKASYNLGRIYLEQEKPNLAIQEFKKTIKLNENFAYAHYNLGCAYMKIGELRKAKNEFLRAIDIKNTVPDFHYNLSYVYKKLKNEKSANRYLEYYNKLIENQI